MVTPEDQLCGLTHFKLDIYEIQRCREGTESSQIDPEHLTVKSTTYILSTYLRGKMNGQFLFHHKPFRNTSLSKIRTVLNDLENFNGQNYPLYTLNTYPPGRNCFLAVFKKQGCWKAGKNGNETNELRQTLNT